MKNIELFLIFSPVGYLDSILIIDTNKVLKDPLDICEFMTCVGCWFYMSCWVGIPNRHEWWSVIPPVKHKGTPFCLNEKKSRHLFDEILSYLRYTKGKWSMSMDYFI